MLNDIAYILMDERHIDILRKYHTYILQNVDVKDIKDYLYQERILGLNEIQVFNQSVNGKEQCRELLCLLPTKGPKAFQVISTTLLLPCISWPQDA